MSRNPSSVALLLGVLTATIPTFLLFQAITFLCFVPLVLGGFSILLGLSVRHEDSRLRRYVDQIAFVLLVVAIVVPFGMIAYHDRSGYPIVLVIPDGYRGPVKLIIDRQEGVEVPLKDGVYTYFIPASGILVINDPGPFRQWHTLTAIYAGGRRIPGSDEEHRPSDTVMRHSLGSWVTTQQGKNEESLEYFVGTEVEKRQYVARPWP